MEIGECGKSGKTVIGVFREIKYDPRVCGHNKQRSTRIRQLQRQKNMLETTFEVRL